MIYSVPRAQARSGAGGPSRARALLYLGLAGAAAWIAAGPALAAAGGGSAPSEVVFIAQIVALITVAALLESVLGICLGCMIFGRLQAFGIIPASVCEACNDVRLRQQVRSAA